MLDYIKEHIVMLGGVLTFLTAVGKFWWDFRRQNITDKRDHLQLDDEVMARVIALRDEVARLDADASSQREAFRELSVENHDLQMKLQTQTRENGLLKKRIEELTQKYNELIAHAQKNN